MSGRKRGNQLQQTLVSLGSLLDAETFRERIADVFSEMFAGMTDEELLCNPDDAKRFCVAVRKKTFAKAPDFLILRTLTNLRKRSALK